MTLIVESRLNLVFKAILIPSMTKRLPILILIWINTMAVTY
ncbi:hypothetical protein ELY15_02800 [Legionella sp. km772]|nr:hypothetical protein ELY15_02800 [Legionella sp. km772]